MSTTQIWNNIVAYSLQIGLLVATGALLPMLLRLKSPGARLAYWQLLLITCLALPWVRPWRSAAITVTNLPVAASYAVPQAVTNTAPKSLVISFAVIALWILAAGIAVRLAWLAAGLFKLALYRRHGRPIPLPREWTGAAGKARLLLSEEIAGPVTFGFFRPVVLLPAGFPAMPEAIRDAILFHELIHVERRDWLFTLIEELVRAVFWFHPAIWWVLGEIQLAREQTVDRAVVEMTQARNSYIDALLAMAGVTTQPDLTPAPLFLRRRHLKQRVKGIVQEVRMSKTRLILVQFTALAAMGVACWFVADAIPLHAQNQMVTDGPGITVNLNGSQLMHRTPVTYPAEALAKGVEGTVVVQVRLDAKGEVVDDAILSGPDELRKGVQQSVLNWHFDKSAASSTRVLNIDFVKPANGAVAAASAPVATGVQVVAKAPTPTAVVPVQSVNVTMPAEQLAQLQENERQAQLQRLQQMTQAVQNEPLAGQRRIDSIVVNGLSDSAREELLAQLPIHVGDTYSPEILARTREVVREFDEHLIVGGSGAVSGSSAGLWTVRIETPEAHSFGTNTPPTPSLPAPAGAVRIGPNVIAANLIKPVKPVYPPLAKMARQQGTVRFDAMIGKDGTMEDLRVISGPPLLIQAAMDAVKQWVYRPTLMNGSPVEVVTTIDVNFALADGPPPSAQ